MDEESEECEGGSAEEASADMDSSDDAESEVAEGGHKMALVAATEAADGQESSDDESMAAVGDQESSDDEESMNDGGAEAAGDEASHGDKSMALVAATEAADGQESSDNEESMDDGKDSSDDESMAAVGDQDSSDDDEGIKGPVEPKEVARSELQKMLAEFDSDDNGEDRPDLSASEDACDKDSDFEEGLTDAETLVLGQSKGDDEDTVPDWYEAWKSPCDEAEDDCSVHGVPEYGEPSPPMLKKHKFFLGPKEPMPDHESRECWPVAMDDNGIAVRGHVLVPPEEHPLCKPRCLREDEDSGSKPVIPEP